MTDKRQRVTTLKEAKALGCLIQRLYIDTALADCTAQKQ